MKFLFCAAFAFLAACYPTHNPPVVEPTVTGTKSSENLSAESLISQAREAKGLPNLVDNSLLTNAAKSQTNDMVTMQKLTHSGRNGSNVRDRIKAQGYKGCFFAENIAKTSGGLENAFNIWFKSKVHLGNIQNPKATEYGIYGANGYWTLVISGPC